MRVSEAKSLTSTFGFYLQPTNENCDILEDALTRYWGLLVAESASSRESARYLNRRKSLLSIVEDANFSGYLETLDVYLLNACEEYPHFGMDEECKGIHVVVLGID